jgi:hypothetical protein
MYPLQILERVGSTVGARDDVVDVDPLERKDGPTAERAGPGRGREQGRARGAASTSASATVSVHGRPTRHVRYEQWWLSHEPEPDRGALT